MRIDQTKMWAVSLMALIGVICAGASMVQLQAAEAMPADKKPKPAAKSTQKPAAKPVVAAVLAPVFKPHSGRAICAGIDGYLTTGKFGLRTFLLRPEWLAIEKAKIVKDPSYGEPLKKAAEKALASRPYSVVEKTKTPASGDKHDYYSIGPYWWPTAGKRNGEPYSRRDGQTNPESRGPEFDKERMNKFSNDVRSLTLAYHYFGDQRYAVKAAELIRIWFLNAETRMNPTLNFGQAVPGVNSGRGEGIIEMRSLTPVVEGIGLLAPAKVFSDAEVEGLRDWFGSFVEWMATSPIGRDERAKNNNHGLHYDFLITHFSLFAGLEDVAKAISGAFPAKRLSVQIDAKGGLPDELARTRSYHYSFFALEAAVQLATVGECVGVDLWNAQTADGRGLKSAFAYLAPYQTDFSKWPLKDQDIKDPEKQDKLRHQSMEPLRLMAWGTNGKDYEALAANHKLQVKYNEDYWLPPLP
jgi:hypothetical protein